MPRIPRSGSTASSHLPLRRRGGWPSETGEYDGADPDERRWIMTTLAAGAISMIGAGLLWLTPAGVPDQLGSLPAGFEIPTVQLAQAQPHPPPQDRLPFGLSA